MRSTLKEIENDLGLHHTSLGKSWNGFYKFVMEKSVACDEVISSYEKEKEAYEKSPKCIW